MIGHAMLLGAGAGLGAGLIAYGIRPPRPALARALAALRRPPEPSSAYDRRDRWLGAPLARLGLPSSSVRQDLALMERPVEAFRAIQVTSTGLGAVAAVTLALLWGSGGMVPLLVALVGGFVGYRLAIARVHIPAQRRRAELRHVLSVVQDLVTVAMAGGAGIDQATEDAAAVCRGWAADRLRHTLHQARLTRTPTWHALADLGDRTGVDELKELASAVQLAGDEGARVRTVLSAHAAAMRGRQIAEMEAAARSAGVRMSMPVLVLALGYGVFLLYPALSALSAGL